MGFLFRKNFQISEFQCRAKKVLQLKLTQYISQTNYKYQNKNIHNDVLSGPGRI